MPPWINTTRCLYNRIIFWSISIHTDKSNDLGKMSKFFIDNFEVGQLIDDTVSVFSLMDHWTRDRRRIQPNRLDSMMNAMSGHESNERLSEPANDSNESYSLENVCLYRSLSFYYYHHVSSRCRSLYSYERWTGVNVDCRCWRSGESSTFSNQTTFREEEQEA